jgi:hypothetical protein
LRPKSSTRRRACVTNFAARYMISCNTVFSLRRLAGWRIGAISPGQPQLAQGGAGSYKRTKPDARSHRWCRTCPRAALQIQIGLDLGMELLMRAMVLVQFDDQFPGMSRLVHQPCNSMSGTSRRLPLLVDGPFGDLHHQTESGASPSARHARRSGSSRPTRLPGRVSTKLPAASALATQASLSCFPRVPLGDEVEGLRPLARPAVTLFGLGMNNSRALSKPLSSRHSTWRLRARRSRRGKTRSRK